MCGADPDCKCAKRGHTFRINTSAVIRNDKLDGIPHYVIPVIMARKDVVMNGAVVPEEEMMAEAWNGVPVTVQHPSDENGGFISANTPKTIEKYGVGRIFNSEVTDGQLKGEAWIHADSAQRKFPALVKAIKSGENLDVSTGYFADVEPSAGKMNGREYTAIHRNLRPDHLALLPGEVGACSWDDGCGVRNKERSDVMSKVKDALAIIATALKINAEPPATDPVKPSDPAAVPPVEKDPATQSDTATMVQALLDCEGSPFVPADSDALSALSPAALAALVQEYCVDESAEVDPAMNAGGCDPKKMENNVSKDKATASALSDEDKAALAYAKTIVNDAKTALVAKVVANSKITKEAAEAMDFATLKVVAEGLNVNAADYSGRAVPTVEADEGIANAMKAPSVSDAFRNSGKKE